MMINSAKDKEKTHRAGALAKDLLFPRRCPVCDQAVRPFGSLICPECERSLRPITGNVCLGCGRPIPDHERICSECRQNHRICRKGCAVYLYRDISGPVYRMKYQGRAEYADYFGLQMGARIRQSMDPGQIDMLIPVPDSDKKRRERGYNQALLLAKGVCRQTGIPLREDLLIRTQDTLRMRNLSASARYKNLKNAFIVQGNDVEFMRIMLIDDICTTGATLDACAQALYDAGAREVTGAVLAIGEIHDQSETGHSDDQNVHI